YYAQPRWQLGNTLLRAGRYDEAFAELRRASASNPALLPNLIDLAYGLYNGDVGAIEQAVRSQTPAAYCWLARICARNGKADEALRLFRVAGPIPDQERKALLTELLSAKRFPEAYEVWAAGRRESNRAVLYEGQVAIADGGFEDEIETDTAGFGWQIWRAPQVISVSLNAHQPHNGSRSLLIEWSGDLQPSTPVVSQLIIVEPKTRYRLSFWARAEELVTGGPPTVTVSDPGGERLFGQSAPLSQATSGWSQYSVEFETTAETRTALIAVRRQGCGAAPCPIFGRAWFDDFTLNSP
ncbi:MAG: carbohydrate binding domain-containing protein, partial [Blastocatellia bacterium]